ncbi:MAG TPA: tetratricopeptide repeat protein [Candidatus Melainabacteria bacterium]|nr:tetratricopeptide repeat protein [Candidatus Melainabacteria bacterium]
MNDTEKLSRWQTRMAVGRMAYDAGYFTQAVRHFRLALELQESGELASALKARSLTGLAKSLAAIGKYAEAEPLILEALNIDKGSIDSIAERAEDYHQLSLLCWRSGRNAESLDFAQKAFELAKKAGRDTSDELTAKLLKHLAVLAEQSGNISETERYLDQAIEFITCSSQLGKNSMIYGDVLLVKVFFLAEQRRYEEAAELYPQAMQIVSMTRGLEHPRVEEAIKIFEDMENSAVGINAERAKKMETMRDVSHHGII